MQTGESRSAQLVSWLALALAAGALFIALERATPSSPTQEPTAGPGAATEANLAEQIAVLASRLRATEAARARLEAELAALTKRIDGETATQALAAAPTATLEASPLPEPPGSVRQPGLDEALLVEAGFSQTEARDLRERYEELQMQQLFLRDQAAREGWRFDERYATSMAELNQREQELLADYGEDAYDWLLYATGRPNQVKIREVYGRSPAADAGLREGDLIVRYDDQRVRSGLDLQQATSAGQAGELVVVELIRGGRPERLRVPRGPLGVLLDVSSGAPPAG